MRIIISALAILGYMEKKKHLNFDKKDLQDDLISANEYTGFLQHLPVSNEDIELFKRMYGGGPYGDDKDY